MVSLLFEDGEIGDLCRFFASQEGDTLGDLRLLGEDEDFFFLAKSFGGLDSAARESGARSSSPGDLRSSATDKL